MRGIDYMSASAKKKLRKEENAALLTEKQRKEQKEARNLKIYTTIFVVAIAVILVACLAIVGVNYVKNSGIVEKNTVAAVIGDEELNSVELSYYYTDSISSTYSNWKSSYGDNVALFLSMMGLDMSKPLDEQYFSDETTWADYFLESAAERARQDYLLCQQAAAEGFTLSEESRATLDQSMSSLALYATIYGYSDEDAYLRANYGSGANKESYYAYCEKSALASEFYTAYSDNLQIDDAAIREYAADKYDEYSSYSYAVYNISYSNFLTGGTEDENGNVTYSDEENDAARAAAKAAADSLPVCTTAEELDAALAALEMKEDAAKTCTVSTDVLYNSTGSSYRQWLADSSRKEGDFTVIPNETTSTDDEGNEITVVNSYNAVVFLGRNDNTRPLANVRHILVSFPGGTTDDNGNTTYTDEEKAAAKAEAEAILAEFLAGDKTNESFAALATEKTDDTGSAATGGLYEDITPAKGVYVEEFTNWAVDPTRKAGDTGIIETTYGYHVMYYVGDSDITYRDSMIREDIRTETVSAWFEELLSTAEVTLMDTSRLKKDYILAQ